MLLNSMHLCDTIADQYYSVRWATIDEIAHRQFVHLILIMNWKAKDFFLPFECDLLSE